MLSTIIVHVMENSRLLLIFRQKNKQIDAAEGGDDEEEETNEVLSKFEAKMALFVGQNDILRSQRERLLVSSA